MKGRKKNQTREKKGILQKPIKELSNLYKKKKLNKKKTNNNNNNNSN